ncbi:MAG: acyltransferase, partial [Lachnospiraceae bacterium]|nr:acyltransferase [Lachnospiraceae bacterium]
MQPVKLTENRNHYIDNLRSISILLLFPVHTFMIWNNFGSGSYIWLEENKIYSTLIVLINPWFMPLLFLLAGISARLSLEKRTTKEFVKQRINKLLIPFITGMVFLVPIQTFYARKFFYNYNGGFIENWQYFFTHFTDLSGYDGAFTPGHLWFILYLFVISITSLIIFRCFPYKKAVLVTGRLNIFCIIILFVPIWIMYYIGNFGGFSIGKNLALYLAGYYIISNKNVMEKVEKNIKWITFLCIA